MAQEFTHIDLGGASETSGSNTISGQLKKVSEEVLFLMTSTSALIISVGSLSSDISSLKVSTGSLASDIAGLKTSVGSLTSDIAGLKTTVGSLSSDITTLQTNVNSLSAQFVGFQTSLDSISTLLLSNTSLLINVDSEVDIIGDHLHSVSYCYPSLTKDITITSAASAWAMGNYALVFPTSTSTSPFDIHYLNISFMNTIGTYELELYDNLQTTTSFIASVRFTKGTNQELHNALPVITPILEANHAIYARLASSKTNAEVNISLCYHNY